MHDGALLLQFLGAVPADLVILALQVAFVGILARSPLLRHVGEHHEQSEFLDTRVLWGVMYDTDSRNSWMSAFSGTLFFFLCADSELIINDTCRTGTRMRDYMCAVLWEDESLTSIDQRVDQNPTAHLRPTINNVGDRRLLRIQRQHQKPVLIVLRHLREFLQHYRDLLEGSKLSVEIHAGDSSAILVLRTQKCSSTIVAVLTCDNR